MLIWEFAMSATAQKAGRPLPVHAPVAKAAGGMV